MELLVFLKLSALEKYCSFVNLPDRCLSDIARLLQTIQYKLYLRQSGNKKKTKKKTTCSNFSHPPPFSVLFLLCSISVTLLQNLPERRSNCKDADLHYSIHEKQSTLSQLQFLFNIFSDFSPIMSDSP